MIWVLGMVTAHSEKERAAATYKRRFGFHPLCAFLDHGPGGTGEPLAIMLRPGNAGANTAAAHHITLTRQALAAATGVRASRPGKKVLIRAHSAGEPTPNWTTTGALAHLQLPTVARPMRGPHPHRWRHRPEEPPGEELQRQPDPGSRSCSWPSTCSPGTRYWPCLGTRARAGNSNAFDCGSSRSRRPWPAPGVACTYASEQRALGRPPHRRLQALRCHARRPG